MRVTAEREERAKSKSAGRIVLVGFMGAGKTTVGRLLSQKVRWRFIDLDDEIVRREQRSIAEIFQVHGEQYFRRQESATLSSVLQSTAPPYVLAVGGGAFIYPGNADLLRQPGIRTIFLDAPVEELRQRCAAGGAERPLACDANLFRQLYEARRGSYMTAELRVETGGRTPQQVVEHIVNSVFQGSVGGME